ncbi:DUF885 domain-containing protein [Nocardioides salsibiostraticola]
MTTNPLPAGAPRPVDAASEDYLVRSCALDPIAATYYGIAGHENEITDYSPDGFAAREELARSAYDAVRAATPVDDRERVAQDAFLERIGLDLETTQAGLGRSQLSVIGSGLHEYREVFDLMATDTEEDWAAIDARLAAIPRGLAGYRITLDEEATAGRVVARRQYAEVAEQVRNWTGQVGRGGNFFTRLAAGGPGGLPASLRTSLAQHAEAASAAYAEFGTFLATDLAPRGREVEAVGREHYVLASRQFLGATIDLEETYAWGWEELHRIAADMKLTAHRILPLSTVSEAVAHLDADPARSLPDKESFRDWMQELADRTLAELADVHFDIPEEIRRIECCLAPTNDGGIYYTGPSEDFTRPGRMWWSVPDDVTTFSPWREVTTVFHEGVPGHHLQVGQTAVRSESLNRWQRLACWVSGHGEGWALYAERLMDDLGYLEDPADRLGMLDAQSFRAARVIVDIGMHLELEIPTDNPFGFAPGQRWTPALGREFMGQHCQMDDSFIDFEVKRYLGWPGQAPSYKVGERIWLEARDAARARHGSAFDLKAFHRAALDLGSLGLDPLRVALAEV